ncbi:MAG: carboxyl transferase domain-containing protein [Acidimicrobiales bacterium]
MPGTVATAVEALGDRQVVLARCRAGNRGGALDEAAGRKLAAAAAGALNLAVPLVVVIASGGVDVAEGIAALHGWGLAAAAVARCSGRVPVLMAVTGPVVSGQALLLGLADIVCLADGATAYVSGPAMVEEMTGVRLSPSDLGGPGVHARHSGVAALTAPDEAGVLAALAEVLAYLPDSCDLLAPRAWTDDPADRPCPSLRTVLPATPTGAYDVRTVATEVSDTGSFLELWAGWAPNLVVGLAAFEGHPVGLVANQPQALAGTLDIPASQKGARFVDLCDAFNLPLLTLVDTPGFFPGKDLEWRGMIRHGGQLAFTYARATVPRVSVILRKAYGGAYIVMDCRTMGNDLAVAWPTAEIAVMGAKGAVEILHRRASPEERAAAEAAYAGDLLTPYVAAERGYVDQVIDPADTRAVVCSALRTLRPKLDRPAPAKHDSMPC